MNRKILLSLLLGSVASPVLACGDSYAPLAEQIASVTAVAVLVLATLLVPATCLLQNKRTTARQLALVYGGVILGLLAAVVMFIVDSHRYMRPAAVTLGFIAVFIPVMTAFIKALKAFRKGD